MSGRKTASNWLSPLENFLKKKKVVQKDSDEGGQKSVLACMNVCVKCKASVTAALTDRCSPIVGEVGKIRQAQMLQGFFFCLFYF